MPAFKRNDTDSHESMPGLDQLDSYAGAPAPRAPWWKRAFKVGKLGAVFASGSALFADGYVNAVTGATNTILKTYLYPNDPRVGHFSQLFSSLAFAGTVVGMLVFGVAVDLTGRKGAMLFASIWITIFSILAAGAWGAGGKPVTGSKGLGGLFDALVAYRFLIGIGIGAEYPAGSVAASENTEQKGIKKTRQQMYFSLATNCAIDWGFVAAAFIPWLLLYVVGGTKAEMLTDGQLTTVWRVALGLGALSPLIVLLFRFQMHESEQYQRYHIKWSKLPWWLLCKRYGPRFLALCLTWWCYDWVTYPSSLYSSQILQSVVKVGPDGKQNLHQLLGWTTLLNVFYLPGTLIGATLVVERLGPKNTMILGLICQSAFAFGLAGGYRFLQNHTAGFILVYGIFLAFGELGPGNNLGLMASKSVSPTATRGLVYGIAAAFGKIGAFVGTYVFPNIQTGLAKYNPILYYSGPFYVSGGLAIFSAVIVWLFIPPVVTDGMAKEDEAFIALLIEHGYDPKELGLVLEDDYDEASQNDKKLYSDDEAGVVTQTKPVSN